jgi:hypothetical protein
MVNWAVLREFPNFHKGAHVILTSQRSEIKRHRAMQRLRQTDTERDVDRDRGEGRECAGQLSLLIYVVSHQCPPSVLAAPASLVCVSLSSILSTSMDVPLNLLILPYVMSTTFEPFQGVVPWRLYPTGL